MKAKHRSIAPKPRKTYREDKTMTPADKRRNRGLSMKQAKNCS